MKYQLVSVPVILRDYIDVKDEASYQDDAHEMLVDIADAIYHNGFNVADLLPEAQKAYYSQTPRFWELVFKDISAIDSQVTSHNVHDLVDDYKEMIKGE